MDATAQPSRRSRRLVIVGGLVAVVVVALALVAKLSIGRHYEESRSYPSAAAIPSPNDLFVLPPWAPDDARDITINVQTQGDGRSLTYTGSDPAAEACTTSPRPRAEPVPGIDLPDDLAGATGLRCAEWFVVSDGTTHYAWDAYLPR